MVAPSVTAVSPPAAVAALVTDVHLRAVLAGIRGLGRAGVRVVATSSRRTAAGRLSRYCSRSVTGPDPVTDPEPFAAFVARLAAGRAPLLVYPGHEAAIDALIRAGPAGRVPLAYPTLAGLAAVRDKARLPDLASAAGLRTPSTLAVASGEELRRHHPPLPFVVKPARTGQTLRATVLVESDEQLAALLARVPSGDPLLVQERVRGPLRAVALVVTPEGRVAARFEQVSRRTFPSEVGVSSEAVSVAPDPELVARSAEMLRLAGFGGLAQLQFVDSAAGPRLIDVNPRYYGSMPLALAAGVNLPAAWHAVSLGRGPARPADYRAGVTFRWLESDLVTAGKGDVGRLLRRVPPPRVGAVWAGDDPLASVVLAAQATRRRIDAWARGRRRARRRRAAGISS